MSVLAAPTSLPSAEWSWKQEVPVAVWSSVCPLPQEPSWVGSGFQLWNRGGFLQTPLGGSGIGPWLLWERCPAQEGSSDFSSPSVPLSLVGYTFPMGHLQLQLLMFSSSEGTSPWFRRGVGTFCHSCKKQATNFCLEPRRKVPVVGSFTFRQDGKKSHQHERKKSNFLPLVLGLKLPPQCQAAASSFP